MTTMNTLLLAPALSPLDPGTQGMGAAIRDFAHSLDQEGWQVTVVIGLSPSADLQRVALAQRLERVEIDGRSLVIHEGTMEGGKIKLIAVAVDQSSATPEPSQVLQAALTLIDPPQSIQVWPKTQSALTWAATLAKAPISIAHIAEPKTGHRFSVAGFDTAAMLILPSASCAQRMRRAKDSKLAPFSEKLFGFVPGYDSREWNPSRDSLLRTRLNPPTLATKEENKKALRAELGLPDADVPLIGIVSRISAMQRSVGEEILKLGVQLVGAEAGPAIESLVSRAPNQVACPNLTTDREKRQLRHRILAAADFVIMPQQNMASSQLFPCRYGAAIIARDKGEFAERLINFDPQTLTGSGFLYTEEHELSAAVARALAAWQKGEKTRTALVERSVALDLSWTTPTLRLGEWIEGLAKKELPKKDPAKTK